MAGAEVNLEDVVANHVEDPDIASVEVHVQRAASHPAKARDPVVARRSDGLQQPTGHDRTTRIAWRRRAGIGRSIRHSQRRRRRRGRIRGSSDLVRRADRGLIRKCQSIRRRIPDEEGAFSREQQPPGAYARSCHCATSRLDGVPGSIERTYKPRTSSEADLTQYRKCRPSGRKFGQNWPAFRRFRPHFDRRWRCPPFAGT